MGQQEWKHRFYCYKGTFKWAFTGGETWQHLHMISIWHEERNALKYEWSRKHRNETYGRVDSMESGKEKMSAKVNRPLLIYILCIYIKKRRVTYTFTSYHKEYLLTYQDLIPLDFLSVHRCWVEEARAIFSHHSSQWGGPRFTAECGRT